MRVFTRRAPVKRNGGLGTKLEELYNIESLHWFRSAHEGLGGLSDVKAVDDALELIQADLQNFDLVREDEAVEELDLVCSPLEAPIFTTRGA